VRHTYSRHRDQLKTLMGKQAKVVSLNGLGQQPRDCGARRHLHLMALRTCQGQGPQPFQAVTVRLA
jgi:hypothetical protein